MNIKHDVDLSTYTTFGFSQRAAHFVNVNSEESLTAAVQLASEKRWPILAIGGGSNLVLTTDFAGLVIRQINQDIDYQVARTDSDPTGPLENPASTAGTVTHVTASAGVNWHTLVLDTIGQGLMGLENLSLIPGSSGAAPVQNIGAYGVELSDRLVSLRALHIPSQQWRTFYTADCEFAYRDSLFKRADGQYIISSITLRLGDALGLQTRYSALADYLERHSHGKTLDAAMVSDAVCTIRRAKLPDPAVLPNAGSFFHNPLVSAEQVHNLRQRYPDLIAHAQADGQYKLAAGWLIDKLGYKGYRHNGVGVHDKQALVLVRYAPSTGARLMELANTIKLHVAREFDVQLNIEPRIL